MDFTIFVKINGRIVLSVYTFYFEYEYCGCFYYYQVVFLVAVLL